MTSVLVGGELSASRPGRFTHRERTPGTHWIGSLVDPRTGLDAVEKITFFTLLGFELQALGHPVSNQSLH
jgi:hypothetical protein